MSIFRNHLPIMGASGQSTGYEIDQSIRFNSADSAYMHRTPSSSGNRKILVKTIINRNSSAFILTKRLIYV